MSKGSRSFRKRSQGPRRKRSRRNLSSGSNRRMIDLPPIVLAPVMSTKVRYLVDTNSTGNYTAQELLSFIQIGLTASANTLCSAVRIRKLELWVQPSSTYSATTSYGVQWYSGTSTIGTPGTVKFDTPASSSFPGHAVYRPSRGSFSDLWHSSIGDSTPVFYLFVTSGGYIDITYDYTINVSQNANTAIFAVAPPVGELSYYSFTARLVPVAPVGSININS